MSTGPWTMYTIAQSRLKYLAHLRSPERQSARSEATAKHVEAKTQLLNIRIAEKQRKLVRREDVNELIERDVWHGADAPERDGSALQSRHGGPAQHRRGRASGPARDGEPRPLARQIAARAVCALARLARCVPVALRWRASLAFLRPRR
jgi:hypothetical protein